MKSYLVPCLPLLASMLMLMNSPTQAKPPEWAPAHGYHKNKDKHKDKKDRRESKTTTTTTTTTTVVVPAAAAAAAATIVAVPAVIYTPPSEVPADIATGRCNTDKAVKEAVGTVVGGIIGGVLGSQIGDGTGKQLATLGGAVLGAYIGNRIAGQMDEADYNCTNRTLEYAADQAQVTWQNATSGLTYSLQPVKTVYNEAKQVCREFVTTVQHADNTQTLNGKACRDAEGVWRALES